MLRWHAAQVNSGLDLTVRRGLKREGFEDDGRAVFSPSFPLQRSRFGRDTGDVFPGYLFLRLDLEDPGFVWQKARRIRGIQRLLPGDDFPGALPEGFVEEAMRLTDKGAFTPKRAAELVMSFRPGDYVEVAHGPFAGYGGEMVRYRKGSMQVLLSLLGGKREVTISPSNVLPPQSCAQTMAA